MGEVLENITVAKTGSAIRKLMDMKPKTARVRRADGEVVLPIEEVKLGDRVLVKPDGRGREMKYSKGRPTNWGVLEIETTKIGRETALAHKLREGRRWTKLLYNG